MEVITEAFQHIVKGFYMPGNGFGFKIFKFINLFAGLILLNKVYKVVDMDVKIEL